MNEQLILDLSAIGAIKFGEFRLKSGISSPIYLDLRVLVSHPRVLRDTARAFSTVLNTLTFDRIAAIPYAALPIGTAVALEMDRPLIYPRREKKDYGTARAVEGEFRPGESAVVIDDVITTGASKLQAIEPLVAAGLSVRDIVVLVDREQGGVDELQKQGYRVDAILRIGDCVRLLRERKRISEEEYQRVLAFLKGARP